MNYNNVKRIIDLLLALNLLVILSPVFLITALIVKLESKGPIIFKQKRIGKSGEYFEIYKFRSMSSDNDLLNFNEKDKVTGIGKVLRKYGIDELPQLLNILKGEMSFIGPRPQIPKYLDFYTQEQKKRFEVLPGMLGPNTCLFTKKTILEKNKIDNYYVDNFSLKQDLEIILYSLKNCGNILAFRETGASGNKGTVEEELQCLKDNYKNEKIIEQNNDESKITTLEYGDVLNGEKATINLKLIRQRKLNRK